MVTRGTARYYSLQITVICVSLITGVWLAFFEQGRINQELIRFNEALALSVPAADIQQLSGSSADLQNPVYGKIKTILIHAASIQQQSQYVYIFGQRQDGTLFFYADNELPTDSGYSPPGQAYNQATAQDIAVFENGLPEAFANSDEYGHWVSIEVPIYNNQGRVLASMDMDLSQSVYYSRMALFGLIPLLIGAMFSLGLFVFRKLSQAEERLLNQRAAYLAVAAHDLKAPLTGIKWLTETLQTKVSTVKVKQALKTIESACINMLSSIDDVVNVSGTEIGKIITGKTQAINISELTQKTFTNVDLLIQQKNLHLSMDIAPNCTVLGDPDSLRRTLGNFISNAVKYSFDNGSLEVKVAVIRDMVQWVITDHGLGIPPEEQGKVLTGYYRASNAKQSNIPGSGLGLYYSQKVIEAHKGTLQLESMVGKGTTITVLLPEWREAASS